MFEAKVVVFDCETTGLPVGTDFSHVQVTLACALRLCVSPLSNGEGLLMLLQQQGRNPSLLENVDKYWCDDDDAFEPLLSSFDDADLIVAYNGRSFDIPALTCHYQDSEAGRRRRALHLRKLFDPYLTIYDHLRRRVSLGCLSQKNARSLSVEVPKSTSGAVAVEMWRQGRRNELLEYCRRDVLILTDLILEERGLYLNDVAPLKQLPVEVSSLRYELGKRLLSHVRYKRR